MASRDEVIEALQQIYDPELLIDVWTLGLIYNLDIEDGTINIRMTFTSPMCPAGPMLLEEIKAKLGALEGVKDVNVEVVFTPPWQPSEELRSMLGI
ncbi:MAG: metal-sulfur cluster assembly factor [Nitrospinota bacterium]|nr:MAG: metal-sulfur cluster assembly factor [Nitrospinota bacterium]